MTGDGVNDVLALKDSDIGVAMGSGSSASRAVAQLVLIDGNFATLPSVVGEGRRVIANIERVANLFITKTVYAFLLAIAVGVAGRRFPFVPRHLTLVGSITIGIPAFVLALAPSKQRARPGFVKRVLRFAVPVGTLAAIATFAAYEMALHETALEGLDDMTSLIQARTTATITLTAIGLVALALVMRPMVWWRKMLLATMIATFLVVLISPFWREFFELDLPRAAIVLAALGIVGLTVAFIAVALTVGGWAKQVPERLPEILGPEGEIAGLSWVPNWVPVGPGAANQSGSAPGAAEASSDGSTSAEDPTEI
jgi:cation-transporting ATPase E